MIKTNTPLNTSLFNRLVPVITLLLLFLLPGNGVLLGQDCTTDVTPPTLTTRPVTLVLGNNGIARITNPSSLVASVADNCTPAGQIVISVSPRDFLCSDIGPNSVVVTATDGLGNATSAPATVTVDFAQPNFSCLSEINLTLNEACQATVVPAMLLTGNLTCLNEFSFDIRVEDDNPANGPIVDGCGRFRYTITSTGAGDLDLDFNSCWGYLNAEDKTPPTVVSTPDDIELLCVDLDDNRINTLPSSVSKCYQVSGATGAIVANTLAPALRSRLLVGTAQPRLPVFTDGCAATLQVCINDVVAFDVNDPQCEDVLLTRRFTATEIGDCTQTGGTPNPGVATSYRINFTRPTLADLNSNNIPSVVNIESCGVQNPTRADYPAPRAEDFPVLSVGDRNFALTSGQAVCNIGVTYSDGSPIITCPSTYKFVRTYTVIDWCSPSDIRTFTQVVKVGDSTAPVFTGPSVPLNDNGDLVYGTNAGNICAAYLRLDDVQATDNCSGNNVMISARIYPGGNQNASPIGSFAVVPGGTPELSTAIPAGRHLLRYTYTDQCGNTGTSDYFFVVEDRTPPVAVCENGLNISISGGANNGFAVLTPANLDNGSYDDCSAVTLSIARVSSNNLPIGSYGNQINLTCEDVGTVRVGMRVTDALDNVNYCWLDVRVEDKIAPSCIAPGPVNLSCLEANDALPDDIQNVSAATLDAFFGVAAGIDNCSTTITQSIAGGFNNCGVGSFTRTFRATDPAGFSATCTQRINVIGVNDYRVTFPTDESGDCAVTPAYAGVTADQLGCDLITTTSEIDTFRTLLAGDECYKLRITYDVVNWCEYNSLGEPFVLPRDGAGVLNRQRLVRDLESDVLYLNVIANNTSMKADDQAFMTLFTDRDYSPTSPQNNRLVATDYAGSDSRGFFRYTQFIKVYDEVSPEINFTEPADCFAGNGADCSATVSLSFRATDACSRAIVGLELDANYEASTGFRPDITTSLGISIGLDNDGNGNYSVTARNVPVGDHALRVRAADGCGNFDVRIIEFCVVADRAPTPICIQTLTVTLMDNGNGGGTAAIWASDFIASPIGDCFGNPVTKYSLYRSSEAGANSFTPRFNPPATNGLDDIGCDDLANGTVNVRVYAFGDNGSRPDYCEVIVAVQDNAGHCEASTGSLSGLIVTESSQPIRNATLTLTGSDGSEATVTTSASGEYTFDNLPLGGDYTVQPEYQVAPNTSFIKTSDLVNMIGVILGTGQFDSPYDYIAADVNRDQSLDVRDIVNTSRVILGLVNSFSGGASWVFVPVGTVVNVSDPYGEAFPEVYNVNDLSGSLRGVSFVAVEVGNTFSVSGRSATSLEVEDVRMEAGQTHRILIGSKELAAFQGTLELGSGLELITAEYTGEGGMNLNRSGEGLIAFTLRASDLSVAMMELEVRATSAITLSEELRLSDAITVREGVSKDGGSQALSLAFSTAPAPAAAQNLLYQNAPNPVLSQTVIRFELAQAGPATLTLRDAAGRLLSVQEISAVAGMNTVEMTNIKASGILTYTLTAGDFSAAKKMVVVR